MHPTNDYAATIVSDSSHQGARITTMLVTLPRQVLSELNTHRVFSRNSASSRAIPVTRQLTALMEHPFIPRFVGRNQPGMQSGEELTPQQYQEFRTETLRQRDRAILGTFDQLLGRDLTRRTLGADAYASIYLNGFQGDEFATLLSLYDDLKNDPSIPNIHKETANRTLEPWMWHTVLITSTQWNNFFALRNHEAADPKIRDAAKLMCEAYDASEPTELNPGQWHLPFIGSDDLDAVKSADELIMVSAGRCARLSYLTHDGKRDITKDVALAERLMEAGHMSPFEHQATPNPEGRTLHLDLEDSSLFGGQSGNLGEPWAQFRKFIPEVAEG